MKKWLVWICMLAAACGQPREEEWLTDFELSGGTETPRYDATINYIKRLEKASHMVHLVWFGVSPQGRKNPLVIVDKSGYTEPGKVRESGRAVVLIQACIHAGEPDGKDAGLMLIRDLVIHKKQVELLDDITLLFMPLFNVDGHERFGPYNRINQNGPKEMGWRTTAQNLNLNRDYLKADAPEMRDWLKVFNRWLPDLFIDCHVTDGADYQYVVTYAIDRSVNVAEPVRAWTRDNYLPQLEQSMKASGYPIIPYVAPFNWGYLFSGLRGGIAPPRLSNGYGAVQNRPALLIETHMFKDYKTRVWGTYQMIRHSLEIVSRTKNDLIQANREADRITESLGGKTLPLNFKLTDYYRTIDFAGFRHHYIYSEFYGDSIIVWDSVPALLNLRYYDSSTVADSVVLPLAYLVPRSYASLIEVLRLHGAQVQELNEEQELEVGSYRLENVTFASGPYEGRFRADYRLVPITEKRKYHQGDYRIEMNQRCNRVIAHLLEPRSDDSFARWGFFNSLFEQKEYGEAYKLDELARQMASSDTSLRNAFNHKLKSDTAFARNNYERLNWFYKKSPYFDQNYNRYPIGLLRTK